MGGEHRIGIGTRYRSLLAFLLAFPLFAHEPITTKVTWSKEVVRILRKHCLGCHSPGHSAPMSLAIYAEARPWAKAIKEEVLERRMPPWPAAKGFGDFENDRSLTALEIDLLVSWADGGAPKGEDRDLPAPPEATGNHLGEPDLVVDSSARIKEDRWIRAWEFRPGNRAAVEQAVIWVVSGGRRSYLGVWAPPEGATILPTGVAQLLPAGSRILVEPRSATGSSLALQFEKEPPARPAQGAGRQPASALRWSGVRRLRHMRLACGSTPLRGDIELLAVHPFSAMEMSARRPDGAVEVLLWVRNYQRRYQAAYRYRNPVALPKGTRLELRSSEKTCAAYLDYVRP